LPAAIIAAATFSEGFSTKRFTLNAFLFTASPRSM